MTDLARLLLHIFTLVAGLAIGWHGHAWYSGSAVSATSAAQSAQTAVTQAAAATTGIQRAAERTTTATERVRIETRTITVDRGCEPGAGPLSPDRERELREVLQ